MATPRRSTRSQKNQSEGTSASQRRGRASGSGNKGSGESNQAVPSSGTGISRTGLPAYLLKQLARDIETEIQGGIRGLKNKEDNTHLLSQLLDSRTDGLYGKRGEDIRVKIGKYVDRWKNLSKEEYRDKVLKKFQVSAQGSYRTGQEEEEEEEEDENQSFSSSDSGQSLKPSLAKQVKSKNKTNTKSLASKKAHDDLQDIVSLSSSIPYREEVEKETKTSELAKKEAKNNNNMSDTSKLFSLIR
jgi:hypothetical protein